MKPATDGDARAQASLANGAGVRVSIESFGLASARNVRVVFDKPGSRLKSVSIRELAYAGSASTAFTWLLNFMARKARGKHLRDDLPPISARGRGSGGFDNGGVTRGFAEMTPRDGSPSSQSEGGTPRSTKRRFIRFGVSSLRVMFAISGIEIVTRRESDVAAEGSNKERTDKAETKTKGMTRNTWRLLKGIASFVDVTVISLTVRSEDEAGVDTLFCDKLTFEASGTTGARLTSLVTARVLRGRDGWSLTDANVHLTAEFDAEAKAIVPVHAGLSGATLSFIKRDQGHPGETRKRGSTVESPSTGGPHKAIKGLLKMPSKCAVEFRRVIIEDRNEDAPLSCVLMGVQASVERMSASSRSFRFFRRKEELQSPFASTAFASEPWAEMKLSADDASFIHDKHKKLAILTKSSASVALALSENAPDDGSKLPATAAFAVDTCEFRHHADAAELMATIKARLVSNKAGASTADGVSSSKSKSSSPWDVVDAQVSCRESFSVKLYDEEGATTSTFSTQQIRGRYGLLSKDVRDELVLDVSAPTKRGVCAISRTQVEIKGFHPIVSVESISVARSETDGDAVEIDGMTVDIDMDAARNLSDKFDRIAQSVKATASAAKRDKVGVTKSQETADAKLLRVIAVDTALRARCVMSPYATSGTIPSNSRGDKSSACALEFLCPLAEVSRIGSEVNIAAGGFTISMFDSIEQQRRAESDLKEDTWNPRIDYESISLESNRAMLVGSFAVQVDDAKEKHVKVSVEGIEFDWEPDAHFLVLKLAKLAKAARTPVKAPSIEVVKSKEPKSKPIVSLDARRVHGSIFVTPGACAQIFIDALDVHPSEKRFRAQDIKFGMNGHTITSCGLLAVEPGECDSSRAHVKALVHETGEAILTRHNLNVTCENARLILPAGLDLGDAMQAMIAGEQAFRDVVTEGEASTVKKGRISLAPHEPSVNTSTPFKPANEMNVRVTGLQIDVEDSNRLERFLRARQAALGASVAGATLKTSTEDALREVASIFLQHKDFMSTGGGNALHVDVGEIRAVSVWGGGKGDGDEVTVKSAQLVRRVDAPYSDSVQLQIINAFTMRTSVTKVRMCIADLNERPIFACDEATMSGAFVQARQHALRILDGQVPIAVGRRRWAQTTGPTTPARPVAMWFTDADFELMGAEVSMATSIEPYMFSLSRELTTRLVPPRLHKHLPGGGGGRPPMQEYDPKDPRPPSMPWWDMLRHQWRGVMRVKMFKSAFRMDAQGNIEHLGGHGGEVFRSELEFFASLWEFDLKARNVSMRCVDFTVSRIQDDEESTLTHSPRVSKDTPKHDMVIFPILLVSGDFEYKSKLNGRDGHCTLYRHDSATGRELFPKDKALSTACFVKLGVELCSKEEFVRKQVEKGSGLDEFVQRVREQTAKVASGERASGYAFPTLALTPDDVEFANKWKRGMSYPMMALRKVWTFRPWGAPRRVRHPEAITLVDLFARIDTVITSNVLHLVNSSSEESDNAYGACFAFHAVRCVAKKAPRTKVEFTLRADSSQLQVPERADDLENTSASPFKSFRAANKSINKRLNFSELDDVIKEMLQGSASSPMMGAVSPSNTRGSRHTSTDPTLVLDTRRVEIIQKAEETVSSEGIQIEVETPRILIEAKSRNSILGWIGSLWEAAQTKRREPSWTECDRISRMANRIPVGNMKDRKLDTILGGVTTMTSLNKVEAELSIDSPTMPKRAPDTKVLFVINITAPQINLRGTNAAGRMLLAAEGGLVVGRNIEQDGVDVRRLVTVSLQQVQAYVAPTNVDLNAGVQWLREKITLGDEVSLVRDDVFGEADAHKQSGSLLRRIFAPGTMVFEYTTATTASVQTVSDEALYAYEDKKFEGLDEDESSIHEVQADVMSEFSVRSPEIVAEMNSNQYAVLIDVIESLFLTPTSTKRPRPSFQAAKLLMSRDRTFVSSMALASSGIVARPMRSLIAARWAAESMEKNYRRAASLAPSEKHRILADIDRLWSSAEKAESRVLEAIKEADDFVRLYRRRSAIRLNLDIEHAAWTLWSGGRPFVGATLSRLSLSRERQVDSSGMMRFKLHGLGLASLDNDDVEEMFTRMTQKSKVDSDAPLIDLFSVRAGSAPEQPIYDHLELSVLPFVVNIKQTQYRMVYKYFFPPMSSGDHDAFENAYKRPSLPTDDPSPRASEDEPRASNPRVGDLKPLEIPGMLSPKRSHHRREWSWDKDAALGANSPTHGRTPQKVVLLRELKIHPLSMKVTYEGTNRSIRDLQLGIDAVSYKKYRGRWRDLTAELKNHIVWSALKSLVGLRGKYVQTKIDTKSVFKRTAERLKEKVIENKRSRTESGLETPNKKRSNSVDRSSFEEGATSPTERTERETPAVQTIPETSPSAASPEPKTKPRRIRPLKNAKKFFASLGLGTYVSSGSRESSSRRDVLEAWSAPAA